MSLDRYSSDFKVSGTQFAKKDLVSLIRFDLIILGAALSLSSMLNNKMLLKIGDFFVFSEDFHNI